MTHVSGVVTMNNLLLLDLFIPYEHSPTMPAILWSELIEWAQVDLLYGFPFMCRSLLCLVIICKTRRDIIPYQQFIATYIVWIKLLCYIRSLESSLAVKWTGIGKKNGRENYARLLVLQSWRRQSKLGATRTLAKAAGRTTHSHHSLTLVCLPAILCWAMLLADWPTSS